MRLSRLYRRLCISPVDRRNPDSACRTGCLWPKPHPEPVGIKAVITKRPLRHWQVVAQGCRARADIDSPGGRKDAQGWPRCIADGVPPLVPSISRPRALFSLQARWRAVHLLISCVDYDDPEFRTRGRQPLPSCERRRPIHFTAAAVSCADYAECTITPPQPIIADEVDSA